MDDPLLEYKGKLREALGLVPYMCHDKRMEAATFWNNLAQELQAILHGDIKNPTFSQEQKFHEHQNTHSHQTNCNQSDEQIIDHHNFVFRDCSHVGPIHNNQLVNDTTIQPPYSESDRCVLNPAVKQNPLESHFPDHELFNDKAIYNQVFSETPSVSPLVDCKDHVSDVLEREEVDVAIKDNGLIFDPTTPLYRRFVQATSPKCPENSPRDTASTSDTSTMHSNLQYGLIKPNEMIAQVPDNQNCDSKIVLEQESSSNLRNSYYQTTGIQAEQSSSFEAYLANNDQDQISTNAVNKLDMHQNIHTCSSYSTSMSQTEVQYLTKASLSAKSSPSTINSANQNCSQPKMFDETDGYLEYSSNVQSSMSQSISMSTHRDGTFTQGDRPLQPIQLFESNPINQNCYNQPYMIGSCKVKAFLCAICNLELPNNDELEEHMSSHVDAKLAPAAILHDQESVRSESIAAARGSESEAVAVFKMEASVTNGTSPSQHTCEVCGKSGFSTKGNLKRHLRAHSGEKPFKCDHCSSCFTEKKSLKIHVRRHTGEKPYKCDVCGKLFSQTGVLQSHMALHLNERKFECSKCSKAFRQRSQLKLHLMRHDGVKKLECSTCSAKFLTKGDLERHRRIHTGERPYSCELCNKTFTRQQSLNEHMNRHTGRKPYDCKYCDKTFSEMSACYKHAKTHKSQVAEPQQLMLDASSN